MPRQIAELGAEHGEPGHERGGRDDHREAPVPDLERDPRPPAPETSQLRHGGEPSEPRTPPDHRSPSPTWGTRVLPGHGEGSQLPAGRGTRPAKKERFVVIIGITLGASGLVLGIGVLFLLGLLLLVAGLMFRLLAKQAF